MKTTMKKAKRIISTILTVTLMLGLLAASPVLSTKRFPTSLDTGLQKAPR
ncbi:MAG: hypothetical protein FWG42_09355 [Clostridiales bacterium]|nr:hypothetical protein [Clostridiales bacterium]